MTEKEFYELLCDVIRRDNCVNKSRILELLFRSKLVCEKTEKYAGKPYPWNSLVENIYLVTTANDLVEMQNYKTYILKKLREIYPVGDDYKYVLVGFEIKPGRIDPDEIVSQEIHFEDIEQQIIDELRSAKFIIWIAMAWFTNKKLYDVLLEKKKEGVNIQIVIDDNDKNRETSFVLEEAFETQRVQILSRYKNIMHEKFCVIDLTTVVHGTFNWTNAANYNKETISVDRNSATARTFAEEFIKLKTRVYG